MSKQDNVNCTENKRGTRCMIKWKKVGKRIGKKEQRIKKMETGVGKWGRGGREIRETVLNDVRVNLKLQMAESCDKETRFAF